MLFAKGCIWDRKQDVGGSGKGNRDVITIINNIRLFAICFPNENISYLQLLLPHNV